MKVEEVAVEGDARRQGLRYQRAMLQRLIGNNPGAGAEQRRQGVGQPAGKLGGGLAIAAANVGMRQRCLARQAMAGTGQGVAKVAQEEMARVRPVGRMSAHLPLEDEDLPRRQALAQMIEGATVAQPELEHRPRQIRDLSRREVEAGALRLKPANETVETAHVAPFGQPADNCRRRSERQLHIGKGR